MKFIENTCAAFLARVNPVSTSANPACMNMTSTAPMTTQSRFKLTATSRAPTAGPLNTGFGSVPANAASRCHADYEQDQGHEDRAPAQPLPFHIVLLLVVGPGVESTPRTVP